MSHRIKNTVGFTLIELLVVVAILAIFSVVVYVALNPTQRLKDVRDAKRGNDVDQILTAVQAFVIDNKGSLPAGISTVEQQIGTDTSGTTTGCTANQANRCQTGSNKCFDLASAANFNKYLKSIPIDPKTGASAAATGYSIVVDANNIVTVKACQTEGTTFISVSR